MTLPKQAFRIPPFPAGFQLPEDGVGGIRFFSDKGLALSGRGAAEQGRSCCAYGSTAGAPPVCSPDLASATQTHATKGAWVQVPTQDYSTNAFQAEPNLYVGIGLQPAATTSSLTYLRRPFPSTNRVNGVFVPRMRSCFGVFQAEDMELNEDAKTMVNDTGYLSQVLLFVFCLQDLVAVFSFLSWPGAVIQPLFLFFLELPKKCCPKLPPHCPSQAYHDQEKNPDAHQHRQSWKICCVQQYRKPHRFRLSARLPACS